MKHLLSPMLALWLAGVNISVAESQKEENKIRVFADVLMHPSNEFMIAHIVQSGYELPMREGGTHNGIQNSSDNQIFDLYRNGIFPYQTRNSILETIPALIYIYDPMLINFGKSTPPSMPMLLGSEWIAIMKRALESDGKSAAPFLGSKVLSEFEDLNYENTYQLHMKPYGLLCLLSPPIPEYIPKERIEKLYPVGITRELQRISALTSAGGDTNALLALEQELEVDFSRKLIQEIVRRKQPPTQEEIWREEIDDLWKLQWKGESISPRQVRERVRDYERQFRAAHEAGEMSDETYLAMMKLIRLDLEQNPKATHLRHTTPPRSPSAPAQP